MNVRFLWPLASALVITSLVSCESPEVPRQVQFREADFAWAGKKGTGVVSGQAFTVLKGGKTWFSNHELLILFPVNAYTTEGIERAYERGENLAYADDRCGPYFHEARTDDQGHFSIQGVAPGEYYVGTTVGWHYWYYNDDGSKYTVYHSQHIYARVTVRNGQTSHVDSWIQGADKVL